MNYSLSIRPAADSDVDEVAAFIAKDNLEAAYRFYDAVEQTYHMIRGYPNRWPPYELDHPRLKNLHKRSVKRFSQYLVFYQIKGQMAEVIRVLHGARDIPAVLDDDFSHDDVAD